MRAGVGAGAVLCTAVLLAGCTAAPDPSEAKNGDTAPLAGKGDSVRRPVPQGRGSRLPDDFNGDGHRDLVLNDLVKAAGDSYGDDAGIGIVYGTGTGGARDSGAGASASGGDSGTAGTTGTTGTGRGSGAALDPAVRQTLGPRTHGARVGGTLPAAFDAMAACDLDKDGFGDLVIATDPPYDGTGMPPVPLQLLFGGPSGPTGRAVVLRIPGTARFGNEWPDHPVCGDFDGDGSVDLAVTASAGRVSFLRGPFSRAGAPRSASAPVPGGGPALEAPAPAADADGDGYDDLVYSARAHAPGTAARGALLLGGPDGPGRAGGPYRFKAVKLPPAPALPAGKGGGASATGVLVSADFTGDKRLDLVTRTHRGETADVIAVYEGTGAGAAGSGGTGGGFAERPVLTFSTSLFLE